MIQFTKATRQKSKLRAALMGPSGSGKTLSALLMAYGITGDWGKVALIDTEHERGRFYANRTDLGTGEFLYAALYPPYSPKRYMEYAEAAAEAVGEDGAVIVDSFSHAWDNEGGVLDIKSEIAKRANKNDYTAWDEAGKVQNSLVNTLLSINCHTIITMRTKTAYAMEINDKGKTVPVKIGLAPVQRENTEYEFDLVMQINRDHIASISKDTTFLDDWSGIITSELGSKLKEWLDDGKEPERCSDCGKTINAAKGLSADEITSISLKTYGRALCAECSCKEKKKIKEQAKNAAALDSAVNDSTEETNVQ
ncbi:MAG: ATP-binding protein [Bacteroides sp.]|nr:ATP-binding protein [Bacteroides sp.]